MFLSEYCLINEVFIGFIALISIRISAQEFHFIPRVGFNLANTYPESFADMGPGINVGIAGEIRFSKLFALEPGVYYSMQGYRYKYKGETANYNLGCTYLYRESELSPGGFSLFKGKEHNGVIQFNVGWRF